MRAQPTRDAVIAACHRFWQVEKPFRMSNHDLLARPISCQECDSVEAH